MQPAVEIKEKTFYLPGFLDAEEMSDVKGIDVQRSCFLLVGEVRVIDPTNLIGASLGVEVFHGF